MDYIKQPRARIPETERSPIIYAYIHDRAFFINFYIHCSFDGGPCGYYFFNITFVQLVPEIFIALAD